MTVRFECTQCGDCCRFGPDAVVWVSREEVERIANHLGVDVAAVAARTRRDEGRRTIIPDADGICPFLDRQTNACTVYAARPDQCRSYPFWPSLVLFPASWEAEKQRCEGIGRGELISPEEITRRLRDAPHGL